MQPKLLRVLQEGQLERLGSPRTIDVDVRVIASTNRDLAEEVRQGRFRADLYYRLNVFPITLPSLRDRREDVPQLVRHLVARLSKSLHKPIDTIPSPVFKTLEQYAWPGNIRELENVLQRAIILSPGPTLVLGDAWMPANLPGPLADVSALVEVERRHIHTVPKRRGGGSKGRAGRTELLALAEHAAQPDAEAGPRAPGQRVSPAGVASCGSAPRRGR